MIYVILTTSLVDNTLSERNKQYLMGIDHVKKTFGTLQNCKILIVENNGKRQTFLDHQGLEVFYTNNNTLNTNNRGIKELQDVLDAMNYLNVKDDDFIVKFTGRYALHLENCPFFEEVKHIKDDIDVIIQYGSGCTPVSDIKVPDCITGLIGMKAKIIRKIEIPTGKEILKEGWNDFPIEMCWAKVTMDIPIERIKIMKILGMYMCPSAYNQTNQYFFR
jgi:hypothetical protein